MNCLTISNTSTNISQKQLISTLITFHKTESALINFIDIIYLLIILILYWSMYNFHLFVSFLNNFVFTNRNELHIYTLPKRIIELATIGYSDP